MLWKEGKWESGKNSPKCNIFSIMGMAVGLSPRAIHFLETFHGNISIADCAYLQPFISYKLLKLTVLKKNLLCNISGLTSDAAVGYRVPTRTLHF